VAAPPPPCGSGRKCRGQARTCEEDLAATEPSATDGVPRPKLWAVGPPRIPLCEPRKASKLAPAAVHVQVARGALRARRRTLRIDCQRRLVGQTDADGAGRRESAPCGLDETLRARAAVPIGAGERARERKRAGEGVRPRWGLRVRVRACVSSCVWCGACVRVRVCVCACVCVCALVRRAWPRSSADLKIV
jgi:hypothetical protein